MEEEEEEDLEEEEDDDDDDEDIDMFLEETPVKQVKRLAPQKQTGAAKVREGCLGAPQNLGRGSRQPLPGAQPKSSLALASPKLPLMLVLVSRRKRWKKKRRQ